jgi:hypothetical protein
MKIASPSPITYPARNVIGTREHKADFKEW